MARAVAAPALPARRRSGPAAAPRRGLGIAVPAPPSPAIVLDGLLRGRAWVVCVGALLAGIVFFNVSLLELNAGIARTSERADALKRSNATLRGEVAQVGSSEAIQAAAAERGFVLPAPGDVEYLRADRAVDAERAVKTMTAPAPVSPQTAASWLGAGATPAPPAAGGTVAVGSPQAVAPAGTSPQATTGSQPSTAAQPTPQPAPAASAPATQDTSAPVAAPPASAPASSAGGGATVRANRGG